MAELPQISYGKEIGSHYHAQELALSKHFRNDFIGTPFRVPFLRRNNMLKIVRELAVDNPLVLKIIMGVIAITFVISMGWYGIQSSDGDVVVSVNGEDIKVQDYRRSYNRAVDYYREMYKDKFDSDLLEKMNLKDKVMEDLVARELWLESANDLGLRVSDDELRDGIMKMKMFHKEGKFERKLYERLLETNRLSVAVFEESQRRISYRKGEGHYQGFCLCVR